MNAYILKTFGVLLAAGLSFALAGAYRSTSAVQGGDPGLGMETVEFNNVLEQKVKANKLPITLPPATQDGLLAVNAYKNVRVLGHITSGEMTRLMTAITLWVAPKQGCVYCHAPKKDANGNIVKDADGVPQADENNLYSDELYTKRVARRMLQMTMFVNSEWKSHVKETGVTCYTCHRGNPVPTNIWYDQKPDPTDAAFIGGRAGQNMPAVEAGYTSLPVDAFRPFLADGDNIRVQSTDPLPGDNRSSIKQTEWSYALMMHISGALGVNCTHCHNTRSMGVWDASPEVRAQAWHGIRLVRTLNTGFLEALKDQFPPERLGPTGDAPKTNCTTCHQGAYKPLLGQSMLKDYMVLAEAKPQPPKTVAPPPAAPPAAPADPNAPPAPAGTAPAAPAPAPAAPAPVPAPAAPAPAPAAPAK